MAILLMVVLVGLMLSALLVPMIITQSRTTRFDSTRVQALNAAQAGIDVTLGSIRASVACGIGVSSRLPCGPGSGSVGQHRHLGLFGDRRILHVRSGDRAIPFRPGDEVRARIRHLRRDNGSTTLVSRGSPSTGTDGTPANGSTTGRTLISTYVFRTPNMNVLGGLLQISSPVGSTALCVDAGSPTAPAGSALVLQPCSSSTPPAAQQVFAYRTDLTLQLLSSITVANPNGLCVNSAHTPAVSGDPARLVQCGPLGLPAAYTHQWSYNDNGQYQAAQSNSASTGVAAEPVPERAHPVRQAARRARRVRVRLDPFIIGRTRRGRTAAMDQLRRVRPLHGRHRPGRRPRPS